MLIKSNFLMSEIPIFTLAIAANISTNDHLERAGLIPHPRSPRLDPLQLQHILQYRWQPETAGVIRTDIAD
jgi:hypothetical protein